MWAASCNFYDFLKEIMSLGRKITALHILKLQNKMGSLIVVKKQQGFLRPALKHLSGGGTLQKNSQETKEQESNTR